MEQIILHCTVMPRSSQECNLNTFPLLGMETSAPTVDDIMLRVLVSYDWMGSRFRELLELMPAELLLLTRGVDCHHYLSRCTPVLLYDSNRYHISRSWVYVAERA